MSLKQIFESIATSLLFFRRIENAMVLQFAEELYSQQPVQRHEEQEEQRDVVDLLTGSFENLVDSTFWHGKL